MSELLHRWGEALPPLLARFPQLAADAGLGAWPVAAVAVLAGLALLLAGVRLGPLLSAAAGAGLGWVVASQYPPLFGAIPGIPPIAQTWLVTAVVGLTCAFVPVLYPILLGVVPGAIWGWGIPIAGRAWAGAAACALAGGAVCFLARRLVLALTAAIPGALLVDAALLVLAARFPSLTAVTSRPTAFAALTAVMVVAGTAAQVSSQPWSRSGRDGAGGRGRMRDER